MRLDQYMAEYWPEYSRSLWQKYIKLGYVSVNGEIIKDPSCSLGEDDEVSEHIPSKTDFSSETLPIIYEDDSVIVINKPAGILTHAKGALNEEFSVAEFFRPKTSYARETNRPGIVHRLDRDTSGVLIGAKNPETAKFLIKQFQDRKVKKNYTAILDGTPKEPAALIDLPIGRNPKKPSQFKIDPNGKSATTAYETVQATKKRTLVRFMPRTGRTHQLRVHAAYLGSPIRGDKIYGKPAKRLFLHATSLEVTLPGGRRMIFEAPLPTEFDEEMT